MNDVVMDTIGLPPSLTSVCDALERGLTLFQAHGGAKHTSFDSSTFQVCAGAALHLAVIRKSIVGFPQFDPMDRDQSELYRHAQRRFLDAARRRFPFRRAGDIPRFNDHPATTKEDIITVWQEAIRELKAEMARTTPTFVIIRVSQPVVRVPEYAIAT